MDLKETLTHKYGPLPGYAWVGIGALGFVVVAKLRSKSSGNVTLTPASNGSLPAQPDMSGGGGGGATLPDVPSGILDVSPPIGDTTPVASAPVASAPAVSAPTTLYASPGFSFAPSSPLATDVGIGHSAPNEFSGGVQSPQADAYLGTPILHVPSSAPAVGAGAVGAAVSGVGITDPGLVVNRKGSPLPKNPTAIHPGVQMF